MTSKTFKCVEHEEEVLEVYPFTGGEAGRRFSLLMPHVSSNSGIAFDSTTAPALALAILEAAGVEKIFRDSADYGTQDFMEMYAYDLEKHIEAQERVTAEAREQAELEADALELFNASRLERGLDELDWVLVTPSERAEWLAVAHRAREMRAEK